MIASPRQVIISGRHGRTHAPDHPVPALSCRGAGTKLENAGRRFHCVAIYGPVIVARVSGRAGDSLETVRPAAPLLLQFFRACRLMLGGSLDNGANNVTDLLKLLGFGAPLHGSNPTTDRDEACSKNHTMRFTA